MDKIFSLIEERTKEELEKIDAQKNCDIFELKEHFQALCQNEKDTARDRAKENFKKDLLEYEQNLFRQNNFVLLAEKQKMIDNVFSALEKKLAEDEKGILAELIAKVAEKIDFSFNGIVSAGEKTIPLLKKFAGDGMKIKSGLDEEGFVILGNDFELDFRLSQIINNAKPAAIFEISKILFS